MSENTYLLIIFAGVIFLIICLTIFVYVMIVLFRRRQLEFEREELRIRMEVQERTAEQIALELHDNVNHEIMLARLNLETLKPMVSDKAAALVMDISDSLSNTFDSIRDISKNLTQDIIAADGLDLAVSRQLDRLKGSSNYEIRYNVYGTYSDLPDKTELVLYRIFQEAVSNIVRHAQATVISVAFKYSSNKFCMCIADDGKGFTISKKATSLTSPETFDGLKTMRARAALINADFTIESEPGVGTKVQIAVPITNNPQPNE